MILATRVKNMLASPNTEWAIVAAEPTDIASLFKGYVLPLAAIGPICGFIGTTALFGRYGLSASFALRIYLMMYVSNLIAVFVFGFVISKLAPRFGSSEDLIGGLKVAAYSATASWIGGVFLLLPILGLLAVLLALYSLYLFYLGLPVVMRAPQSSALPYAGSCIGVAIVIYLVFYLVKSMVLPGPTFM